MGVFQIKKVISVLDKVMATIENYLLFFSISVMLITCAIEVLDNFIFRFGFMWTGEVLRIMLIWTICTGASVAAGKREHLGVMFFLEKLPKKVAKWVRLFTDILSIGVCSYIVVSGVAYVKMQFAIGSIFSVTRWPQPVAQLAVPICFAFVAVRIIFTVISDLSSKQEDKLCTAEEIKEGGVA
jgi:TRAP-type C4-dicarboxylate transport system permease small subunit